MNSINNFSYQRPPIGHRPPQGPPPPPPHVNQGSGIGNNQAYYNNYMQSSDQMLGGWGSFAGYSNPGFDTSYANPGFNTSYSNPGFGVSGYSNAASGAFGSTGYDYSSLLGLGGYGSSLGSYGSSLGSYGSSFGSYGSSLGGYANPGFQSNAFPMNLMLQGTPQVPVFS